MKTINVGLLGLGTIGSGAGKLFQERPDLLDRRGGAKLSGSDPEPLRHQAPPARGGGEDQARP